MNRLHDIAKRLDRLRAELPSVVTRVLTATALRMEEGAKLNARARMKTRSGTLARSIRAGVTGNVLKLAANAGGDHLIYAHLQEEGGIVRPKNKKWLTIPVEGGPAMTPAGVSRYKTARDYPRPLRFIKVRGSLALLVDERKRRSDIVYVLVKKVTVPGRYYMRDAFKEEAPKVEPAITGQILTILGAR